VVIYKNIIHLIIDLRQTGNNFQSVTCMWC